MLCTVVGVELEENEWDTRGDSNGVSPIFPDIGSKKVEDRLGVNRSTQEGGRPVPLRRRFGSKSQGSTLMTPVPSEEVRIERSSTKE